MSFGSEILKVVPGLVSTEVDAHLSFDEHATINRVMKINYLLKFLKIFNVSPQILCRLRGSWNSMRKLASIETESWSKSLLLGRVSKLLKPSREIKSTVIWHWYSPSHKQSLVLKRGCIWFLRSWGESLITIKRNILLRISSTKKILVLSAWQTSTITSRNSIIKRLSW